MTAPVADLKMRASKIAAVDPTLHVRINGCADESLNAWAHDASMRRVQRIVSSAGRRLGLLPMVRKIN